MQVQNVNSQNTFKALNLEELSVMERNFYIKNNFKKLRELSANYDIRLTSANCKNPALSAVYIDVMPLRETLTLWDKLFPPKSEKYFETRLKSPSLPLRTMEEFNKSIEEAIENLKEKLGLLN